MAMALPTFPPLLMSPAETAPPLPAAVATPPLPAAAVSMYCAATCLTPTTAVKAPARTPFTYFIDSALPRPSPSQNDAKFKSERLAHKGEVGVAAHCVRH